MRITSLKIPANSANRTLNYACFEKEIQRRLNGRRTRCASRSLLIPPPHLRPFRLLSRDFPSAFGSAPSDVQPSSMVSFAGAVWLPVQSRKSDGRAQSTKSWTWANHYKARSPSRTPVTPCKTMVRRSPLRQSNTSQSRRRRRQGHSPRLQSPQNTPIKRCLRSLQTPRRRPLAPP